MRGIRTIINAVLVATLLKPMLRRSIARWRREARESAEATIVIPAQELLETVLSAQLESEASSLQKTAVDPVVKAIEEVSAIAEQTSTGAQESSAFAQELTSSMQELVSSAQELAGMASGLQENIGAFKLIGEVEGGARTKSTQRLSLTQPSTPIHKSVSTAARTKRSAAKKETSAKTKNKNNNGIEKRPEKRSY